VRREKKGAKVHRGTQPDTLVLKEGRGSHGDGRKPGKAPEKILQAGYGNRGGLGSRQERVIQEKKAGSENARIT